MTILEVSDVSKKWNGSLAVKDVSLSIEKHSKVGIVGETGSGKSTLLKLLSGHQQKDSGIILFDGKKVKGPEEQLIAGHPEMQYLSQYFELSEFISVAEYLDNIYLIAEEDAEKIYKACQIDHLLDKDTRHLSGGEKQRVALAKALTHEPQLLLLDEPFSNLDFLHKKQIKKVVEQVGDELGTTIILVSHEPKDVLSWADEILVMRNGRIVQKGAPKELYDQPVDEYVAGLFGSYSLIDPRHWKIQGRDIYTLNDKAFIRPEQFQISANGRDGVKGKVVGVKYNGSFDEVEIEAGSNTVDINTAVGYYHPGEEVVLCIKKGK